MEVSVQTTMANGVWMKKQICDIIIIIAVQIYKKKRKVIWEGKLRKLNQVRASAMGYKKM